MNRSYSLGRALKLSDAPHKWGRVLDYTVPETHRSVPRPGAILTARMGSRYDNFTHSPHQEHQELLTVLRMHKKAFAKTSSQQNPAQDARFRKLLRSDVSIRMNHIRERINQCDEVNRLQVEADEKTFSNDIPAETDISIDRWSEILLSPDLSSALSLIEAYNGEIAPFVVLHTLGRHANSTLDVYNALRFFDSYLGTMPRHMQPEATVLMIEMAQVKLIDMVPVSIDVFLRVYAPQGISSRVMNELLWRIARYGTRWSLEDTPLLSQAQDMLLMASGSDLHAISPKEPKSAPNRDDIETDQHGQLDSMNAYTDNRSGQMTESHLTRSVEKLDTKGLVALAYIGHFRNPDKARQATQDIAPIVAHNDPPESIKEFAYAAGVQAIRLLTSADSQSALLVLDETKQSHIPAMWSALIMYLSRNKILTPSVAMNLWTRLMSSLTNPPDSDALNASPRLTGLFTNMVLGAIYDYNQKQLVLQEALRHGLRLTPALAAQMMKVSNVHDLETATHDFDKFKHHPRVAEQILRTQTHIDTLSVWKTYKSLTSKGNSPTRGMLECLCRAAWDVNLLWDGMYASQRAMHEIKHHVRGAAAPAEDVLRIYPTNQLLYAYVIMLGRAGYTDELGTFLEWMNALQHEASKRVLLALIHYSPHGAALLRLGQNVPNSQWPTEDEYAVYKEILMMPK